MIDYRQAFKSPEICLCERNKPIRVTKKNRDDRTIRVVRECEQLKSGKRSREDHTKSKKASESSGEDALDIWRNNSVARTVSWWSAKHHTRSGQMR